MSQSQAKTSSRYEVIDLAKGILVTLMVVYHSLNYTQDFHLGFRYLPFLPLSFVLITGFLIGRVYGTRFPTNARQTTIRLISRGAKLFLLFIILNLLASVIRNPAYGKLYGLTSLASHWAEIFVLGSGRLAAFEVLLPLSYLLMLAPFSLALNQRNRFAWLTVVTVLLASAIALDAIGYAAGNLSMLTAGAVAIVAGGAPVQVWGRLARLELWAIAYVAYQPLSVWSGHVFGVQLVGALIGMGLICCLAAKLTSGGAIHRVLTLIGRYSLLGYIVQIAVLQVLSRALGRPPTVSPQSTVLFFATFVLMVLAIAAAHRARQQPLFDRFYTFIFA